MNATATIATFVNRAAAKSAGYRPIYDVAGTHEPLADGNFCHQETGETTVPIKLETDPIYGPNIAHFYLPVERPA